MADITLGRLRELAAVLVQFAKENETGETQQLLSSEELEAVNGIGEPLLMTRIDGGVVVHYVPEGDWTRALLLPENQLDGENYGDQYGPVDEALEWFFNA